MYIIRKAMEYFKPKINKAYMNEALKKLTEKEKKIFLEMSDYDKFHSLEVYKKIKKTELKNNEKYLFCGDLVQNLCFKFPLIPLFGENKEELIESWKKIILNGYDKFFPATGKEVMARDLIRRLGKDEKNRI